MTRRDSIRIGVFAAFAAALSGHKVLAGEKNGTLTCDLSQWQTLKFIHNGREINVGMNEVFAALTKLT